MTGRFRGAAAALVVALCCPEPAVAQTTRLVVIKADGLRFDIVDRMVRERNPRTGQSVLPWIERVFYEGGTRLSNFYVRGLSLSGPAWSMLDTGQHLRIKGNVEFDRYIEYGYDYLNFLPFWLANARGRAGDMWGAAVLDEIGIPLLIDAYGHDERYQSAQLYQRGSRWMTLGEGVQKRFTTRTPRELVDEWFVGFDTRDILTEQQEREVITGLANPRIRYLDYYTTEFDHATHHNRDDASHRFALQDLDGVIGRIWTAISRTPEAAGTALVLVSDHGVNTDARVYSQGYNLVSLLASAAGGGHHVVTKRRLMKDYSIKGIYPLVPLITTASPDSRYLKGREDDYPTALLDFDGNERAAIHVRDSTFNLLHALLVELQKRKLPAEVRRAAVDAFLAVLDRPRPRRAPRGAAAAPRSEGAQRGARDRGGARCAAPPHRAPRGLDEGGRGLRSVPRHAGASAGGDACNARDAVVVSHRAAHSETLDGGSQHAARADELRHGGGTWRARARGRRFARHRQELRACRLRGAPERRQGEEQRADRRGPRPGRLHRGVSAMRQRGRRRRRPRR
jgi:hypothetical protein